MEEKVILNRIKQVIEAFRLSINAFSQQIGLPQNSVNNYINEKRGISLGFILSILSTYPNISAEWLLRGEGEMLLDTKKNTQERFASNENVDFLKGQIAAYRDALDRIGPKESDSKKETRVV